MVHARTAPRAARALRPLGALLLGALPAAALVALSRQDPAEARAPLPAGVAARVDGEDITLEQYRDYLVRRFGRGPLFELVHEHLVERAAARLGLPAPDAAQLDLTVEELRGQLLARHGGDRAAVERELAQQGFTLDEYAALYRHDQRLRALAAAVCVATREVDPATVERRFEERYGQGGVRVEVRHVYLSPARERAARLRAGDPPEVATMENARAATRARARALAAELQAGADFAALAAAESHDLAARQNGGLIPGYNYVRYGRAFADAVRAAEVGAIVGPVESETGFHVLEVLSRTVTALEDVRDALAAELAAAPASPAELQALRERLRAAADVTLY